MSQHPICFMDPNGSVSDTFFAANQMYLQPAFGSNTRDDIREKLNSHVKRRIQGEQGIPERFYPSGKFSNHFLIHLDKNR